jgi:hypothetical protein
MRSVFDALANPAARSGNALAIAVHVNNLQLLAKEIRENAGDRSRILTITGAGATAKNDLSTPAAAGLIRWRF